jgi:hypothetical protein
MTDDGLEPLEVTGRWVGFYCYRSEHLGLFPIVAEIRRTGHRLTGEMYDQITDISDLLERIVEAFQNVMKESTRRKLEKVIEQFGKETVGVTTRLPDTSDLDGRVTGSVVHFRKTYRGSIDWTWSAKGKEIASVKWRRHTVQYSGHIYRDSMCIEGEWIIRQRGLLGRFLPPQARGRFELYRKP